MRRLVASASFALVFVAGTAFALSDGGSDASILDGGGFEGGIPDTGVIDAAASDAAADAIADATVDAASDASDGSSIKDAKSDVCDPNVEPCTVRADTGPENDAGDTEEPAGTNGCSCNSVPTAVSVSPFLLLLAGLALLRRKR